MFNQLRMVVGAVMIFSLALGGLFANAQEFKSAPPKPAGDIQLNKPNDSAPKTDEILPEALYWSLRDVINQGARLFNEQGDQAGCYRVYQGALITARPFVGYKPGLQRQIDEALVSAEKMPKMNEKAFALRKAIDLVREQVRPPEGKKKAVETVPLPKPDTKKKIEKPETPPNPGLPPPSPNVAPKKDEPKNEVKADAPKEPKPAAVPVKLAIEGPKTAKVAQKVQFKVKVTNTSSKPLEDVAIEVGLSEGLENPDRFHTLNQTLNPALAAQETRTISIDLVASKTGTQKLTITAIVGELTTQTEAVVTVEAK